MKHCVLMHLHSTCHETCQNPNSTQEETNASICNHFPFCLLITKDVVRLRVTDQIHVVHLHLPNNELTSERLIAVTATSFVVFTKKASKVHALKTMWRSLCRQRFQGKNNKWTYSRVIGASLCPPACRQEEPAVIKLIYEPVKFRD